MTVATMSVPITKNRDGVFCVSGTRVTLDTLIAAFDAGASAEEIALQYPSLKLADVYSTISYYLQNQQQLQEYLQERKQLTTITRKQNESRFNADNIRSRLMQRRANN